jgi:hypothetical protein
MYQSSQALVSAAARWHTPTHSKNRTTPFTTTHNGTASPTGPHFELAKMMLGLTDNSHHTPADDVALTVATHFGAEDTFRPTPVGASPASARSDHESQDAEMVYRVSPWSLTEFAQTRSLVPGRSSH